MCTLAHRLYLILSLWDAYTLFFWLLFLFIAVQTFSLWTNQNMLLRSTVDRHVHCFQISLSRIMLLKIFLTLLCGFLCSTAEISVEYLLRSKISRPQNMVLLIFSNTDSFLKCFTNLYSHKYYIRVTVAAYPHNTWYL